MGSQLNSPSTYPALCWRQQPRGPSPAKRHRTEESSGLKSRMVPSLQDPMGPQAAGALTYMVVPAESSVLQLPLHSIELVLEPETTSVRKVSLGEHTLLLIPKALLGSTNERSEGRITRLSA